MMAHSKDIFQLTIPTPFLVGPVNSYLIKGDALTLIDTGPKTPEAREQMKRKLSELNVSFKDIELLILTHHHPDHIGLANDMVPNAVIAGHRKLKPWLEQDHDFYNMTRNFYFRFYEENGVPYEWIDEIERMSNYLLGFTDKAPLHTILSEGDALDGLNGWTVVETPGHAQSHVSLLREEDGTMIAGDHLISHISSNAIIEAPYSYEETRPKTLLQYRESLMKCKHAGTVYSGHGEKIDDPAQLINERVVGMDEKARVFKRKMGDRQMQVFDLCREMYPSIYKKQTTLTFSETLGHLDLLEERGEVTSWIENGSRYYRAI